MKPNSFCCLILISIPGMRGEYRKLNKTVICFQCFNDTIKTYTCCKLGICFYNCVYSDQPDQWNPTLHINLCNNPLCGPAGSHRAAIDSVAQSDADIAAVDSTVLERVLKSSPTTAKNIHVLTGTSLGPLPSYPVVFNKCLPGNHNIKHHRCGEMS